MEKPQKQGVEYTRASERESKVSGDANAVSWATSLAQEEKKADSCPMTGDDGHAHTCSAFLCFTPSSSLGQSCASGPKRQTGLFRCTCGSTRTTSPPPTPLPWSTTCLKEPTRVSSHVGGTVQLLAGMPFKIANVFRMEKKLKSELK